MKGHHFTNFENERKKIIGNHPKVPILGPEQACGQSIDSEDLEMKWNQDDNSVAGLT